MNAIDAIQEVVDHITKPFAVVQSGVTFTTTEFNRVWVGAWVELIGANENKRYQVVHVSKPIGKTLIELDAASLDGGVDSMALLLDFQFGHYKEIQQTLAEQVKDTEWKSRLYPKLLLFLDIEEDWSEVVETSLNLAIVTNTKKEWKAADRKVKSFEVTLHPLFTLVMNELDLAHGITIEPPPTFRKWDRYFWGSQLTPDKNVFAAMLDAVEILDLQVIIDKDLCNNFKR